jgi:hypothetical protein
VITLILGPILSEFEAFGKGLKDTACHAIKDLFPLDFRQVSDIFRYLFLCLLQLLVGKVEEVLISYLEDLISLSLWEGGLEILPCKEGNLLGNIEEGAEPKRENTLQVGAQSPLSFADESRKCMVGCLSHLPVRLISQDATEMVEEECQKILDLV